MTPYFSLASCYDALTADVNYDLWANFYENIFRINNLKIGSILDLACGTGTLSYILAERGYEVTGTDASPDMLSEAFSKISELGDGITPPMFINQTMQELDLYGTVDAAVCCLDGINYLPGIKAVEEAFGRVLLFLEPGGIFIFDVNTVDKLKGLDGQVFIDEKEGVYCVWRAEYDEDESACFYGMDIFTEQSGLWRREFEEHIEYAYSAKTLENALISAGFEDVNVFGELKLEDPSENENRIFITARKKN
jgi:Methylase involved in ubiquinone/menaquinone biosynthesis